MSFFSGRRIWIILVFRMLGILGEGGRSFDWINFVFCADWKGLESRNELKDRLLFLGESSFLKLMIPRID